MAKKPVKSSGTSKIRFVMLEAEMPEGDLNQITAAIQNALRPPQVNGPHPANVTMKVTTEDERNSNIADLPESDEGVDESGSASPGTPRPRKPPKRKIVEMDLDSDPSLAGFVDNYPPKNEKDRYLVAVAFLCEHRKDIEGVNADHVYTCFRKMEWSTGSKDFGQPLRNLKASQFIDSGTSTGTYVINHIGLDKVHKLADE